MKPEQLLLMNMNLRGVSGLGALLQQKLKSGVVLRPERGLARPREALPLACSPCVLPFGFVGQPELFMKRLGEKEFFLKTYKENSKGFSITTK